MGTTTRTWFGTVGTTAAFAAILLMAGVGVAEAGKGKNKRDIELLRPAAAPDADAAGTIRITTSKRGEKGLLKLRNLDPRTRYEVHDAETDEVLGIVRTNRRGKAKMKLRRKVAAVGKKSWFDVPDSIEICRVDDDAPLLVGDTDVPERGDAPAFGFAHYDGAPGWSAFVDMFSFTAEEMEGFHLSVSHFAERVTERGAESGTGRPDDNERPFMGPIALGDTYELLRDTMADDELPLGVDSVAELAGRAFRVVDGEGTVLVRGVLPSLERPEWNFPEFPDFPKGERPNDERGSDDPGSDDPGSDARKFGDLFDDLPRFDGIPEWDFPSRDRPNSDAWDFIDIMPPDFMPFPMPEREESDLRLEIADENGDLTDVGALDRIIFPEIDWPRWECPMDGDHDSGGGDEPNTTERDGATDGAPDRAMR